jgi:hypothetical protein
MGNITYHLEKDEDAVVEEFIKAVKAGQGAAFDFEMLALALTDPTPRYDAQHGDDVLCGNPTCGHPYYRHFDTYEDMSAVGCKYCGCETFVEPS